MDGFFKQQKEEVLGMSLTEFDEEIAIRGWREDGIEEGKTIDAQQKAVEDAMNILKKKYPVNDISEITGLTLEQVQELQNKFVAQPAATN